MPPHPSRKRQHIVDAATELFRRHGVKRVTVTEVCAEAGVSKVTFYKHFANKLELARHVIDDWSERMLARVDEVEAMAVPFPDKVRHLIEDRLETARAMSPTFFHDVYGADEALRPFLRERSQRNLQRFLDFIVAAQRAGEVRPDIAPELILLVLEQLNDLARDDRVQRTGLDHVELTRQVNNLFYFGILQRPEAPSGGDNERIDGD